MAESYIKKVVAGGIEINEPISSFKVAPGQTVNSGDFVALNNYTFIQNLSPSYSASSTVPIDENRFIIAYPRQVYNFDNQQWTYFLSVRIIQYVNGVMTVGTEFNVAQHTSPTVGYQRPSIDLIDSSRFIIAFRDASFNNWLRVRIGNFSGTTITSFGNSNIMHSEVVGNVTVKALSTSRAIVSFYNTDSSFQFRLKVLTFSGTNMDNNTHSATQLSSSQNSTSYIEKYDDTSVIANYSNGSNRVLQFISSSSGTSISTHTTYTIPSSSTDYSFFKIISPTLGGGVARSSATKVEFFRFSINGPNKTISFTDSQVSIEALISSGSFQSYVENANNVLIDGNTLVFQVVTLLSGNPRYVVQIKITDSSYQLGPSFLAGDIVSGVFSFNGIFNANSTYLIFNGFYFINSEKNINKTTNTRFFGIAKESKTAGQLCEVYNNG
jgi:hypothetical protein